MSVPLVDGSRTAHAEDSANLSARGVSYVTLARPSARADEAYAAFLRAPAWHAVRYALGMHNHRRARARRGVTLIEVMIVVTILGILSAGIAVAVTHQLRAAQIQTTLMNAKLLRPIAAVWRADHPEDECPTPAQLRADKLLDVSSKLTDAWGSPYVIVCEADETGVVSYGPDRRPNTEDDLVEPDPDHGKVATR